MPTQGEIKQVWIPVEHPYLITAQPADSGVDLREEIDASSYVRLSLPTPVPSATRER